MEASNYPVQELRPIEQSSALETAWRAVVECRIPIPIDKRAAPLLRNVRPGQKSCRKCRYPGFRAPVARVSSVATLSRLADPHAWSLHRRSQNSARAMRGDPLCCSLLMGTPSKTERTTAPCSREETHARRRAGVRLLDSLPYVRPDRRPGCLTRVGRHAPSQRLV